MRMPNIDIAVLNEPAFQFTEDVKSLTINLHPQPHTTAYDDFIVVNAEYENQPITVGQVFNQLLSALFKPLEEHDLPAGDSLTPHAQWAATIRTRPTSQRDILRNVDLYQVDDRRPGLWFHGITLKEDADGQRRYDAVFRTYSPMSGTGRQT